MDRKRKCCMHAGRDALAGILMMGFALAGLPVLEGCAGPRPAPPPMQEEIRSERPNATAVWVPGHWDWKGKRRGYVWIPGHWRMTR
jgi:hypothetical protein